jgi:hypothetical protein
MDQAMRKTAKDKALKERAYELRQWRRWRRERFEELLNGPYAEQARALIEFCKIMNSPTALIEHVKTGPWRDADPDVRAEILAFIDAVIIARREDMNMDLFDDALPGKPENTFLTLRAWLA